MTPEEYEALPFCEHDSQCSGFGWMHDAEVTQEIREDLGLPATGEISMKRAVRLMRKHRKEQADAH